MSSRRIGATASVTQAIARNSQPNAPARRSFGPVEKLDEDVARQLPLQILARCGSDLAFSVVQRPMVALRLVGQHDEMHERVGVRDNEQDRREEEEGEQRQFDVEEWQLDRILEKEIGVRHRARGDREIEQNEQIGEPKGAADRRWGASRLAETSGCGN